jgi:release factor glutamine methyltransferase
VSAARTWREVLHEVTEVLDSPEDARWLIAEAGGFTSAELIVALDELVPLRAGASLTRMVERRAAGEPLQYSLGHWGFRTLDLMVDRRVLIPRPETEQVVEAALAEARRLAAEKMRVDGRPLVVVDLGTGSGAIALSMAAELGGADLAGLEVWATDSSPEALEVAGANLCGLAGWSATRVRLAQGRWFAALPEELRGRLDLVVSNPPYIGDDEVLPDEVARWEPAGALRAGPTGVECLVDIFAAAPGWLADRGVVVAELASNQAETVTAVAVEAGFVSVEVRADLSGRARMIVARR